jgi:anti-sigma-K factor RskA
MDELEDVIDDAASWWRDLAAGSALAVFAVAAAVMFLR